MIGVSYRDGETRLDTLQQSGCLKLRMPKVARGRTPEAVLINTAGGLTGGDRLAIGAEIGAGARLALATQTAERLYRAEGGTARIDTHLTLGSRARLAWLPQETIAFEGSALERRLRVDMAPDTRLLAVEPLVMGRTAMGERIGRVRLRESWRVHVGGRLLHAEALRLGGHEEEDDHQGDGGATGEGAATSAGAWLAHPAGWGERMAAATVLCVAPGVEACLDAVRAVIGPEGAADCWPATNMPPAGGGASGEGSANNGNSAMPARLVVRLLAADGFELRARLVPVLCLLNALLNEPPARLGCTVERPFRAPAGRAGDRAASVEDLAREGLPSVWSL